VEHKYGKADLDARVRYGIDIYDGAEDRFLLSMMDADDALQPRRGMPLDVTVVRRRRCERMV